MQLAKSTHQQLFSQQSTQNTASLPLQTCEKAIGQLLMNDTGGGFSVRNDFANLSSIAFAEKHKFYSSL